MSFSQSSRSDLSQKQYSGNEHFHKWLAIMQAREDSVPEPVYDALRKEIERRGIAIDKLDVHTVRLLLKSSNMANYYKYADRLYCQIKWMMH